MQTTSYRSGNSLILNLHFRFKVREEKGMCRRQEIYKIYVFVSRGQRSKDPLLLRKHWECGASWAVDQLSCFPNGICGEGHMVSTKKNKSAILEYKIKRRVRIHWFTQLTNHWALWFVIDAYFMPCYVCYTWHERKMALLSQRKIYSGRFTFEVSHVLYDEERTTQVFAIWKWPLFNHTGMFKIRVSKHNGVKEPTCISQI